MKKKNKKQKVVKTPTVVEIDYGFATPEEALEYLHKIKEKPLRREYLKVLEPYVPAGNLIKIKIVAHGLIDGYENDLYDALIRYVKTGEEYMGDSRVMNIMFHKAVGLLGKECCHGSK